MCFAKAPLKTGAIVSIPGIATAYRYYSFKSGGKEISELGRNRNEK
ncbi:hypothetical protein FX988_04341 (plasmid) [Paraglaciecola mesophila]|uniref:Uncharacterized protein n=1 Tax=Paraglaciecola mesophila TaxID=197222 RepID=A0A857JPT2_9ALTE|nr:hypothetical protein FX988_04341 [Paraglaciecola mesophila]